MKLATLKCAKPLAVATCWFLLMGLINRSHAAEPASPLVSVAPVEVKTVAPVMWVPGNIISRYDAQIASEQAGQIRWVAELGAAIKKGEPLARIDDEALKLHLAEQEAVLQRLRASESFYEKQLQRLATLIANSSIAKTELDAVERDRAINAGSIQQQQVLIAQTKLAISKARITAPFNGVLVARRVQPGEYVQAGQAVVQLVDTDGLDIQVQAPVALAPFVGSSKRLTVEYGDTLVELPVRTWTPAGTISSRTIELRLDARPLKAVPGMAVRVAVPKAGAETAMTIPRDALVIREQQMYVLKVSADGTAQRLPVNAGAGNGDRIAVTAALQAGDQLIVRGAESTQHGQKVRIANAATIRGGEKVAGTLASMR